MKKSLIALAVMAAAGAASAQSSVTLFGIVDVAYTYTTATGNGKLHQIRSDAYNSSRVGLRGTEDLGGGMSASFWLEMGFNADNGSGQNTTLNNTQAGDRISFGTNSFPSANLGGRQGLTFNRRSTVSLAGPFGELRLGRDYVPTFWNLTVFDPFGTNGVGSSYNVSGGSLNPRGGGASPAVRSSNSVGYFLPANLGGFYGQAMYAYAEQPNRCSNPFVSPAGSGTTNCAGVVGDGKYWGARLGWASGPFNVAGSYGFTNYNNGPSATQSTPTGSGFGTAAGASTFIGDYVQWNLGGQWDAGMAKVMAQFGDQTVERNAGAGERSLRHWLIGALVPVGAGEIRASYTAAKRDDSGVAAGADNSKVRQFAVGYVHNFSKRTAVYTTYAQQRATAAAGSTATASVAGLSSLAATSGRARGFDIGLRHSF